MRAPQELTPRYGTHPPVAVVDLSAKRRQRVSHLYCVPNAFDSVDALCAAMDTEQLTVDAAIVASGGLHCSDAGALVLAGVHTLVEKPLAYSLAELQALESMLEPAGRSSDKWLRIGYMKEYDPAVAAARERLAGLRIREVRTEVLHPADSKQLEFARLAAPATDIPEEIFRDHTDRFRDTLAQAVGCASDTLTKLYSNVLLGSVVHDLALTRHLGLGLGTLSFAERVGTEFPGSVYARGRTVGGAVWDLSWHFVADFPEYRETVTVLHDEGRITLQFATPYILNAPTVLFDWRSGPSAESRRIEQSWPQQEAFARELMTLVGMVKGEAIGGSSIDAARRDLENAQALWNACARSEGAVPHPDCEAARGARASRG